MELYKEFLVLIETLWNVNCNELHRTGLLHMRINRNIVECKYNYLRTTTRKPSSRINRNIVECKYSKETGNLAFLSRY